MEAYRIAENYVSKDLLVVIAKLILKSQDVRENSWNGNKYTKSHIQAAKIACKNMKKSFSSKKERKFWIYIVAGWNQFEWNDTQIWAEEILKKYKVEIV